MGKEVYVGAEYIILNQKLKQINLYNWRAGLKERYDLVAKKMTVINVQELQK